jgi:glycerate kinase
MIGFDAALESTDLVITGEGKVDAQTLDGKAPYEVARRAKLAGKPCIAIAGCVPTTPLPPFDVVFGIPNKPMSLEESCGDAEDLIESVARNVATMYSLNHT